MQIFQNFSATNKTCPCDNIFDCSLKSIAKNVLRTANFLAEVARTCLRRPHRNKSKKPQTKRKLLLVLTHMCDNAAANSLYLTHRTKRTPDELQCSLRNFRS